MGEVVLLDRGVGPDGLHQPLFWEHRAGVLHQAGQRLICFGCETNHGAVTPRQKALVGIQTKVSEFINRHVAVTSVFPILQTLGARGTFGH